MSSVMQHVGRKTISARARVKADVPEAGADVGEFEAVVAVFGNVDLQGDVIEDKAFDETIRDWRESGDPVPVVWSHQWDDPMAHIGFVDPNDLEITDEGLHVLKGQIPLTTEFARQVHSLMIARRIKEFSFSYLPFEGGETMDGNVRHLTNLDLIELGPTLKGANPETSLLGMKSAIASHSTGTSDDPWDGPANEANLPNSAAALVAAHAWRDPDGDPDAKATYKFIHHMVGTDGRVGAASTVGSSQGIAILNGGRGGSNIPDGDRQGVWAHLARHITDGTDREPPALKDIDEPDPSVPDSAGGSAEHKYGRVLSKANEGKLREAEKLIGTVLHSLDNGTDGDGEDRQRDGKAGSPGEDRPDGGKAKTSALNRIEAELELRRLEVPKWDSRTS